MSHYASSSGIYWFTRSAIDISIRISRARQVDVIPAFRRLTEITRRSHCIFRISPHEIYHLLFGALTALRWAHRRT